MNELNNDLFEEKSTPLFCCCALLDLAGIECKKKKKCCKKYKKSKRCKSCPKG